MHTTRNRRAARPAAKKANSASSVMTPPFLLCPAPPVMQAFPADVWVPPHRGASFRSIDLTYPAPAAHAPLQPKLPTKAAKPKKPVNKRTKSAKQNEAKRKPAARPRRAVPLEKAAEPLVEFPAIFPPRQPLPRRQALVPYRSGGILGQLTAWLRERSRRAALLLFPPAAPPKRRGKVRVRVKSKTPPDEIARLRAENERLRLQLEALLALQTRSEPVVPAS